MSNVDEISLNATARYIASIVPQRLNPNLIEPSRFEQLVSTAQVRTRGWYFPYFGSRFRPALGPNEDYLGADIRATTSVFHLESWRLYRNGQFLFRTKLWEAGDAEVQSNMRRNQFHSISDREFAAIPGFVSFVGLIYIIAETYEFAARMASGIPYESAVEVRVGLRGTQGWAIGSTDFGVHLSDAYIARSRLQDFSEVVEIDELIARPLSLATRASQSIFRQFGWMSASDEMIGGWQRQIFR